MKTYTKPSMMVLSISANDPLCLGCTGVQTRNNAMSSVWENLYGENNPSIVKDGVFTFDEALSAGLFDAGYSCENHLDEYCKMQSAVNIFTS